jgi:death-on-curing protein
VNEEPNWIDQKALLLLHEESLAIFGDARGLRDPGFLELELLGPVNQYVYDRGADLATLAAAYGYDIVNNHAFAGDKRAAFLGVGLFLALNGQALRADPVAAVQNMLALAAGDLTEESFAQWIRDHQENEDAQ